MSYVDFSTNGHYTENQPKVTAFVLWCFIVECETGGPTHLSRPPQCRSPCCIITLSAFAMNMVTTTLGFGRPIYKRKYKTACLLSVYGLIKSILMKYSNVTSLPLISLLNHLHWMRIDLKQSVRDALAALQCKLQQRRSL